MRKCTIIQSSPDRKRHICIDDEHAHLLLSYFQKDERHIKKFRFICDIILGGHKNYDVYDKEEINEKCKGVTAMKFFKGQENDRIYCKEIITPSGSLLVVTAEIHLRKKTQKISHIEKVILERTGSYEYEIPEF